MPSLEYDISDILEQTGMEKEFAGQIELRSISMGDREVEFAENVKAGGVLRNVGHGILAEGTFHTKIKSECSRCLDKFDQEITGRIEELFVSDPSKYDDEEKEVFPIKAKTVDIEQPLYQLVVTEIPFKPLCKTDCAGICPTCGKNLNHEPHICNEQPIDIRMSKLKDYFKES